MAAGVDISQFLRFQIRCKIAAEELSPNARKEIRAQARAAARRAEASAATAHIAAAVPGRDRRPKPHIPLRALLAADISVADVPQGAEIRQGHRGITGRNADALPRGINAGVWRHPVYGRGRVVQLGDRDYFNRPISEREPLMSRAIARTCAGKIDDTLNKGLG